MMTNKEILETAIKLDCMDTIIREKIDDEYVFERWLMRGVPDGSSAADLCDIAENDADYLEIVDEYYSLMREIGYNEDDASELVGEYLSK